MTVNPLVRVLWSSVTLTHKFCAAHRLVHHPGKCNRLHGHNYRADITVTGFVDPMSGMVADFARVKEIIGGWIDQQWDHKMVLNSQDPMLWVNESLTDPGTPLERSVLVNRYGHLPFIMPEEPTAENMGRLLAVTDWFKDHPTLRTRVRVTAVTLFETDTCSATTTVE